MLDNRTIVQGDALEKLVDIPDNSIDEMLTDPPYGYSFMNKAWDKAVVSVKVWRECLRVLKPGAFAFVMSAPRQDVLSHMIVNLSDAGFKTDFTSMYWAYATGFPKAMNISKAVDKRNGRDSQPYKDLGNYLRTMRLELKIPQSEISENFPSKTGGLTGCVSNWELGMNVPTVQQWKILKQKLNLDNRYDELIGREEAQREIISRQKMTIGIGGNSKRMGSEKIIDIPETPQAKKLDGSYAGFQPKPAVEVILVCMKPLSEKNYIEQAMKNGKGVAWFDDCRIPYQSEDDLKGATYGGYIGDHIDHTDGKFGMKGSKNIEGNNQGRFPANLLVSDNALDDEGDFSRYYSLDSWEAQFIITPKPSKSEKNKGLPNWMPEIQTKGGGGTYNAEAGRKFGSIKSLSRNHHPTVKPVSLFKYLITLGSRPNDFVLDPFMGSGTTAIAAELTARNWIGIELNPEYEAIIRQRVAALNLNRMDKYFE